MDTNEPIQFLNPFDGAYGKLPAHVDHRSPVIEALAIIAEAFKPGRYDGHDKDAETRNFTDEEVYTAIKGQIARYVDLDNALDNALTEDEKVQTIMDWAFIDGWNMTALREVDADRAHSYRLLYRNAAHDRIARVA